MGHLNEIVHVSKQVRELIDKEVHTVYAIFRGDESEPSCLLEDASFGFLARAPWRLQHFVFQGPQHPMFGDGSHFRADNVAVISAAACPLSP
jgi:hypothetical protein